MSNQNTKKSPGIEVAPFYCKEDIEMDNCGCLNISLSLFYFYFVTNLQKKKKIMAYARLQLSLPPSHYAFSCTTSRSPFELKYFMDDPTMQRYWNLLDKTTH